MKNHTLLFLIVLLFLMLTLIHGANAQKGKVYVVKVKLINGEQVKGDLLYVAGDSMGLYQKNLGGRRLKLSEIESVRIHQKGNAGRSAAIGAGVGAALGALIGLASYEPCPTRGSFCIDFGPGVEAAGGATFGAVTGAVLGALVGSGSKNINIHANKEMFDSMMMEYGFSIPRPIPRLRVNTPKSTPDDHPLILIKN